MSKTTDLNIRYAYELLFNETADSQPLFKAFNEFCKESMSKNEVVVLYEPSKEFRDFTTKYGVMIGRKEAVIRNDGELLYTEDYGSYPERVVVIDGGFYEEITGWDGSVRYRECKY